MSHTFTSADGVVFHYDGAFDGNVELAPQPAAGEKRQVPVTVSITSILEFAAEAIRAQRLSEVENASVADLLGLPGGTTRCDDPVVEK